MLKRSLMILICSALLAGCGSVAKPEVSVPADSTEPEVTSEATLQTTPEELETSVPAEVTEPTSVSTTEDTTAQSQAAIVYPINWGDLPILLKYDGRYYTHAETYSIPFDGLEPEIQNQIEREQARLKEGGRLIGKVIAYVTPDEILTAQGLCATNEYKDKCEFYMTDEGILQYYVGEQLRETRGAIFLGCLWTETDMNVPEAVSSHRVVEGPQSGGVDPTPIFDKYITDNGKLNEYFAIPVGGGMPNIYKINGKYYSEYQDVILINSNEASADATQKAILSELEYVGETATGYTVENIYMAGDCATTLDISGQRIYKTKYGYYRPLEKYTVVNNHYYLGSYLKELTWYDTAYADLYAKGLTSFEGDGPMLFKLDGKVYVCGKQVKLYVGTKTFEEALNEFLKGAEEYVTIRNYSPWGFIEKAADNSCNADIRGDKIYLKDGELYWISDTYYKSSETSCVVGNKLKIDEVFTANN